MAIDTFLPDCDATADCGAAIAPVLEGGEVIVLSGPLGSGKTTLVRGLLRARGVTGTIHSPTFTLVEHYPVSSLYFYHIDLYRFSDPSEWETSGLADCFRSDAVCLVEWPERVGAQLGRPDLELALAFPPAVVEGESATTAGRRLHVVANSAAGERCESAIRSAMTRRAGIPSRADAGARSAGSSFPPRRPR